MIMQRGSCVSCSFLFVSGDSDEAFKKQINSNEIYNTSGSFGLYVHVDPGDYHVLQFFGDGR